MFRYPKHLLQTHHLKHLRLPGAEIVVDEKTVYEAAGTPPKLTTVVPVKFEPEIVTNVFVLPLEGEKDVMLGA